MARQPPERMRQARLEFFHRGRTPEGLIPQDIQRSWQRCASLGLPPDAPRVERLTQAELDHLQEQNALLLSRAQPELEALHEQVAEAGSVAILTDPNGLILQAVGDPHFAQRAQRVALQPGVSWDETSKGTNAIGTALADRAAVQVRGAEHYVELHRVLTCTAAPIFDPFGRLVGVLDISGDARASHGHALALVRMSAQLIEHGLFHGRFADHTLVHLHCNPGVVGTSREGLLVFAGEQLLAANRCALQLLGIGWQALGGSSAEVLFGGRSVDRLAALLPDRASGLRMWRMPNGQTLYLHIESGKGLRHEAGVSQRAGGARARTVEPDEFGGMSFDATTEALFERARRVANAGIPVLIQGETGTGKEIFARRLHAASRCAHAPFVAVNCAAIPEGLIESELFGYEEGAFTGARRKGMVGKLREANGGVLFLDEIGDMPVALQARLLRALQERRVMPLGSDKTYPVDFVLICATHRNLPDLVARGEFREDLYYRLNHFVAVLPPLRERDDLPALVSSILDRAGAVARGITLAPAVLPRLRAYRWPGNLRQLDNLLRTLVALCDDRSRIDEHLLPAEIRAFAPAPEFPTAKSDTAAARTLEDIAEHAIHEALAASDGNIARAARLLGVHRSTLHRRLRRGAR